MQKIRIAVAKGDGIGPEIMDATLSIIGATGAPLDFEVVDMGKTWYEKGHSSGMTPEAKNTIEQLGVLLKGPMETPKGKGMKSINVTARKMWSTYANKRVFKSLNGVETVFSKAGIPIDITMVRENIEDTYGGIEHMLTEDVALCRRFITRPGSIQVHKYTFEMARKKGAKKVTCGHKANIMKITDGLFLECFYEVAKDYPEIKASDIIVDDLAMKLVSRPNDFEVIVLPNLQGDILSDLCAGLVGGLGFAPSANIGDNVCIFEAVHGSAPDIAGKNIANPTALLISSCMMLRHLGMTHEAIAIENSLYNTLQQGYHTIDFGIGKDKQLNTTEFSQQIIKNLQITNRTDINNLSLTKAQEKREVYQILHTPTKGEAIVNGADFFVESTEQPKVIAHKFKDKLPESMSLIMISNRGTQVYPDGSLLTDCVDQFRVRIEREPGAPSLTADEILDFAKEISRSIKICSIEWLMMYGGVKSYSLAQGQ
ncbi:isocitrate/isopropylmalate family dehydrogenase [Flavipsychrobacter stenotrophus]|uniref:isocitrate/isopropylmalate family dehydrogenase n=1 Tax=Flavipsychrobacter stenotrophus TaxID=2077091 RepID=UPI001F0B8594|nr:isocitrate/isopropylmalate family dehydrogenase [Flavipsychrobacter stenotrophus]